MFQESQSSEWWPRATISFLLIFVFLYAFIYVRVYLLYSCLHFYSYLRTISLLGLLFILFWYCFTPFFENMRIQNTENSEKENSELKKKEIQTKREVNKDKT